MHGRVARSAGRSCPFGARCPPLAGDVYEALTADRPCRAGLAPERALAIIATDVGAHLDGDVVNALVWWVDADGASAPEIALPACGPACAVRGRLMLATGRHVQQAVGKGYSRSSKRTILGDRAGE